MKNSILMAFTCAMVLTLGMTAYAEVYDDIYAKTTAKEGVKEITYDEFMTIRKSGDKYVLLDTLSKDNYNTGHIPDAKSMPLGTINAKTAAANFSKGDNIIVYCGNFRCKVSTKSAKELSALGYKVLDYKGGLQEWMQNGNKLVN